MHNEIKIKWTNYIGSVNSVGMYHASWYDKNNDFFFVQLSYSFVYF